MNSKLVVLVCVLSLCCLYPLLTNVNVPNIEKSPEMKIFFCPGNCEQILIDLVSSPNQYCAFYDIDTVIYNNILDKQNVILDEDAKRFNHTGKIDRSSGLMHNKFCVNETTVWTGSTNPTIRGTTINYNDLIRIQSKSVANFYRNYWLALNATTPHTARKNFGNLQVCYSPKGNCIQLYVDYIKQAKNNITLAAFSFTHPRIRQQLLRAAEKNISITVLVEDVQCHSYCQVPYLEHSSINIYKETTDAKMHMKVLIVDEEIIISGSMNPTKNGNDHNDENIIIVEDKEIASKYTNKINEVIASVS